MKQEKWNINGPLPYHPNFEVTRKEYENKNTGIIYLDLKKAKPGEEVKNFP